MIQNRTQADRTVEGNLAGEEIQMRVGDMAFAIQTLTNLYTDREAAVVREYSTNGRDAHVAAGVTAPIEVTTPTPLSPFLTIRDFGTGLSLEDIREVYSQYGVSTKRNTNEQNGMLGYGCKSALAYSDQFTVTSVNDGVRIQVVVARHSLGASMKVVDTSSTSEPNGTTVTIPARALNQIEQKAKQFFQFWEPGTVKLNGREPDFVPDASWVVPGKIALVEGRGFNEPHRVVMGGVAYPAPHLQPGLGSYTKVVAFVDIGAVDFAPSREALMDTDTTTATLRAVEKNLAAAITASIAKDVADAANPREAVERKLAWRSKVPSSMIPADVKYNGRIVPENADVPDGTLHAPMYGRKQNSHSQMTKHMPMPTVLKSIWVTGWDHASFTVTTKKKLMKYCEDNQLSAESFIISPTPPDKFWIAGIPFIKWEDVKTIKLPRNAPNPTTGRIPGSYDIWEDGDWNEGVPGDDIDQKNPVFWMFGRHYAPGRSMAAWLHERFPGSTLVMLRKGREGKFQRLFPKSREATDVLRDEYMKWSDSISADDRLALAVKNDYRMSDYDWFDPAQLDDPRFAKIAKIRKRNLSALETQIAQWHKLGMRYEYADHEIELPLHDYALLPTGYSLNHWGRDKAHLYRYMNNEYAHKQAQK